MSWFNEGFDAVEQRAKEVAEAMNSTSLPDFRLEANGEALVSFVTTEPFNFYEHYHPGTKRSFTCARENCVLCASGNKASFKAGFLIIDHRHERWNDKKTGEPKERINTLKVWKTGITTAKTIAMLHNKRGLLTSAWEVTKTGEGTSTNYPMLPSMNPAFQIDPKVFGGKAPKELLMESLKPKTREYILKAISGVNQPQQGGYGQPQGGFQQYPQGGGQQQGGWAPQGQQNGWGQPPQQPQQPQYQQAGYNQGNQGGGQQGGWFQQQQQGTFDKPKFPDLDAMPDSDVVDWNK